MPAIFISYRREDSIAYSGRLYDRLTAEFGKSQVFMDIDSIDPGADFIEAIEKTVAACDAVLVVIGRQWLTVVDAQGRRRLENPGDFVRLEVSTALSRKVRVVPVLVGGALMPRSDELPETLAGLARRHALDLPDTAFQQTLGRLIDSLRQGEQERLALAKSGQFARTRGALLTGVQMAAFLAVPGIFLFAGIAKVLQPWPDFARAIYSFRIVPTGWTNLIEPIARTLPWFEIAVGLGIVVLRGFLLRLSLLLATSMLAFFFLIGIRALAKGFTVDCGCFGASNRGNIDAVWLVEVATMLAVALAVTAVMIRGACSLKPASAPGPQEPDLAEPASYDLSTYHYDPTPYDPEP